MNLADREELLFREWEKKRPGFVRDGVIEEQSYLASYPKVVFVLKELNGRGGAGWDLRDFIRKGARSQTFNNIARWALGLRNLDKEIPWSSLEKVTEEIRKEILRSVCAVNLKKTPGGHTAKAGDVNRIAFEDKPFLTEQLSLYRRDLVICCGNDTFQTYRNVIDDNLPELESTSRGVHFYRCADAVPVINFAHPEARVAGCILHYALIDSVKEISLSRALRASKGR